MPVQPQQARPPVLDEFEAISYRMEEAQKSQFRQERPLLEALLDTFDLRLDKERRLSLRPARITGSEGGLAGGVLVTDLEPDDDNDGYLLVSNPAVPDMLMAFFTGEGFRVTRSQVKRLLHLAHDYGMEARRERKTRERRGEDYKPRPEWFHEAQAEKDKRLATLESGNAYPDHLRRDWNELNHLRRCPH